MCVRPFNKWSHGDCSLGRGGFIMKNIFKHYFATPANDGVSANTHLAASAALTLYTHGAARAGTGQAVCHQHALL